MIRLYFRLEMLSDYHVGSGFGQGSFSDSLLLRDNDGIPVIRGTTISGLWRDAVSSLFRLQQLRSRFRLCDYAVEGNSGSREYCGKYERSAPLCPVCRLFGSPCHPKEIFISSARPFEHDIPASGNWKRGYGSQVSYRLGINPLTRRADEQRLFSEEDGSRLVFYFSVGCSTLVDAALLTAGARLIRSLGRSRRRGHGNCRVHLTGADNLSVETEGMGQARGMEDYLLHCFERYWINGEEIDQDAESGLPGRFLPADARAGDAGHPVRLLVIARLDEPMILARSATAGNLYEGVDYIPGNVLLGALAALARQRYDILQRDMNRVFTSLFCQDAVRFPCLYPAKKNGFLLVQCIPAPLDLRTCKLFNGAEGRFSERHSLFGVSMLEEEPEVCPDCGGRSSLASLSGWLTLERRTCGFRPARRLEMHNSISPDTGRVTTGELFGYDALDRGNYFTGELVCRDWQTWQDLQELTGIVPGTSFELRLGKGIRRGYGKTRVLFQRRDNETEKDSGNDLWIGAPLSERLPDVKQPIIMTVLTDTILLDPWGRFAASLDLDWRDTGGRQMWLLEVEFARRLREAGWSGRYPQIEQVDRCYSRNRTVDAFNNKQGLPRFRDLALVAGSTARLNFREAEADLIEVLQVIETQGLGLRRAEGFGRIAFNHPIYRAAANGRMELPEQFSDKVFVDQPREYHKRDFAARLDGLLMQKQWTEFGEKSIAQTWAGIARLLYSLAEPEYLSAGSDIVADVEECLSSLLGKPPGSIAADLAGREKTSFINDPAKGARGRNLIQRVLRDVVGDDCWNQETVLSETEKRSMLLRRISELIADNARG